MTRLPFLVLALGLATASLAAQQLNVIPRPREVQPAAGTFTFPDTVEIAIDNPTTRLREIAEVLVASLQEDGFPARIVQARAAAGITLKSGGNAINESYWLEIRPDGIAIDAPGDAGLLWGVQTLRQLWWPGAGTIAAQVITDAPKYSWRGSMLDVGRHLFPVEYILSHLEWMSLHKLNVFRWHLTEDQGWRIEIDAYPRLTSVGAWRIESDGSRYGGFYTKDEIRRVVERARQLGITVVPEIEVPGHARAALAAYPDLGCIDYALPVPSTWGVFTDVMCPGKESTFEFIETVLTEVLELFPSRYIHIGGDEVPKERWKNCDSCQEIIRRERLGDEHGLQRWMIARVGRWLADRGRRMIGWDEIIDGGLPDNATVQAWQSSDRIGAAMALGADVIASPNEWVYLNGSAGNLPLGKVASFDPAAFTASASGRGRLLGIEAPLWTEHVTSAVNAELMWWPRLLAVAEVAWSGPADTLEFAPRIEAAANRLRAAGVAVGPADRGLVSLSFGYDSTSGALRVQQQVVDTLLQVVAAGAQGEEIVLRDGDRMPGPGVWELTSRWRGQTVGERRSVTMVDHLAVGRPISLVTPADSRYPGTGPYTLVDGARGTSFNDGFWNGWWGPDLDATVDLGSETTIHSVSLSLLEQINSWIAYPGRVAVMGSRDGANWVSLGSVALNSQIVPDASSRELVTINLPAATRTRWVWVVAHGAKVLPEWHPGAGNPAWIFADEIVIE